MHSDVNDYDVYDSASDEMYSEQYDPQFDEDDYGYDEEDYYADEEDAYELAFSSGFPRVLRLAMLLIFLLLLAAVILFGVIPYVEAMTNSAPPLPPALQA